MKILKLLIELTL